MTKPDDALTRAIAELRAAAELVRLDREPRLRAGEARRTKKQSVWLSARERFLAAAVPADRWYRAWVKSGRLELLLSARTDEPRESIALPSLYPHRGTFVFEHEVPGIAERGTSPNFTLRLGETLELRAFGRRSKWGGPGGTIAQMRDLAELANVDVPKLPWGLAGVEENLFAAATRIATLFRDDVLEPLLTPIVLKEAASVRSRIARTAAARAVKRGEPGALARMEAQLRADGRLREVPVDASAEVRRKIEEENDAVVSLAVFLGLEGDGREGA